MLCHVASRLTEATQVSGFPCQIREVYGADTAASYKGDTESWLELTALSEQKGTQIWNALTRRLSTISIIPHEGIQEFEQGSAPLFFSTGESMPTLNFAMLFLPHSLADSIIFVQIIEACAPITVQFVSS